MKAEDVVRLLKAMGCERIGRPSPKGWIRASCPFSPWLHDNKSDNHPSFAVHASDDGNSSFRCLSCGTKGTLQTLVWRLEAESGRSLPELQEIVQQEHKDGMSGMLSRLEKSSYLPAAPVSVGGIVVPARALSPELLRVLQGEDTRSLPEEDLAALRQIVPPEVETYLANRRLPPEVVSRWELGWHAPSKRIVIPIRDLNGKLVGISGRDTRTYIDCPKCAVSLVKNKCPVCGWRAPLKFLHSNGFNRDFYLYGEHRLDRRIRVGYLVEGFFDVMYLSHHGYTNTVAVLGSYLSTVQVEKVVKFFDRIVLVPDGDPAGYDGFKRMEYQLRSRLSVVVAKVPTGLDPDQILPENLEGCLGPVPVAA